jgi:hypothetical protein
VVVVVRLDGRAWSWVRFVILGSERFRVPVSSKRPTLYSIIWAILQRGDQLQNQTRGNQLGFNILLCYFLFLQEQINDIIIILRTTLSALSKRRRLHSGRPGRTLPRNV